MTEKEIEKLIKANDVAKSIRNICEKYGYESSWAYIKYWRPVVWIRQMERKSYYPDVRLDIPFWKEWRDSKNWIWGINAWAYGSMNIRDYNVFLYQLTQAKRMVEELNELDLTKLYVVSEDDWLD